MIQVLYLGFVCGPVEFAESLVEHLGRVADELGPTGLHRVALGRGLLEDFDVQVLVGGHPLCGPGTKKMGERVSGFDL